MDKPKTIFCDIDGTLLKHAGPASEQTFSDNSVILPNTLDAINLWDKLGYKVILTTGRKESLRSATIKQLERVGIWYDQLIMGFGGSERVIINNTKWDSEEPTAHAVTVPINEGLLDHDFLESFL